MVNLIIQVEKLNSPTYEEKYKTILKVLSLYRITFGQPNQEQLLHSFMEGKDTIDENTKKFIKNICLDLAPISLI